MRRAVQRIKIHHLGPSMDSSIRIVRQLEEVLVPYRMTFRDLKGKKQQLPLQYICKENNERRNSNALFAEGR
jgi:hypothetical protein